MKTKIDNNTRDEEDDVSGDGDDWMKSEEVFLVSTIE